VTSPDTNKGVALALVSGSSGVFYFDAKESLLTANGPELEIALSGVGQGLPGQAATITVGSTSTLPPGLAASVTNSGNSNAAVLNFAIPQGTPGI
jgi:hypothetical protein